MSAPFPNDAALAPARLAAQEQLQHLRSWHRRSGDKDLSKITRRADELGDLMQVFDYVERLERFCFSVIDGQQIAYEQGYAAGYGVATRSKLEEIRQLNEIMLRMAERRRSA